MSALHYRKKSQERELARRQLAALEAADAEAANCHVDLPPGGTSLSATAAASKDGSFKGDDGNGGMVVLPPAAVRAVDDKSAADLSSDDSSETGDKYQGVKESPEERRQRTMVRQTGPVLIVANAMLIAITEQSHSPYTPLLTKSKWIEARPSTPSMDGTTPHRSSWAIASLGGSLSGVTAPLQPSAPL